MGKNYKWNNETNNVLFTDGQMMTNRKQDLCTLRFGCYENAYEGLRNALFTGFGGAIIPNFLLAPGAI